MSGLYEAGGPRAANAVKAPHPDGPPTHGPHTDGPRAAGGTRRAGRRGRTANAVRSDLRVLFAALLVAVAGLVLVPSGPARAATAHHVTMSGYAFQPAALTITAGDTVTWTNHDTAPHDVQITYGPAGAHSPLLSKGASWSFTFTAAGSYTYVCSVHPGMAARLVVRAAPTRAPAPVPTTRAAAPAPATASHAGHPHAAAVPSMPSMPPASSAPATTAGPAAASQTQAAPPAAAPAAQSAQPERPLRPLLVLAALVAGVSVVCLLLVGSRSAAAAAREAP